MKRKIKSEKGITLIALIITIVILLILAAITITTLRFTNLIGNSKDATDRYKLAQVSEQDALRTIENHIDIDMTTSRDEGNGQTGLTEAQIDAKISAAMQTCNSNIQTLQTQVQSLSQNNVGFINASEQLVGDTDFTDGTTYTATEDCAVVILTYGTNGQGFYAYVDDVLVYRIFYTNCSFQYAQTIYLKKGQVLRFAKDNTIPATQHLYRVYKLY